MKKALSIVLILTMLASLLVAAIPASARDSESVTMDTPWTTEDGWTAINNAAGLKNMASNGKYYLTADITLTADNYNNKKLEGVYIHGNGKTITLKDTAICQNAKDLTVRWLNIAGSVDTDKWGKSWCSPFGIYNDKTGWAIFENVKSSVNVDYGWNSNRFQSVSGVFHVANAGSRFVNVEYSGTITVKGYALLDYIGLIVANAIDTTFTNCTVSGKLKCSTVLRTVMVDNSGNYVVDDNGDSYVNGADVEIGNFCGKAQGCTFTDCTNDGYIFFSGSSRGGGKKANANHNYGASYAYVGGFVGFNGDKDAATDKKTTFTRCTNTAKADIYLEGNCGGVGNAGGFVGYSRMASIEMTDCTNSGDVLANAEGAWWLGGLIGMWDRVNSEVFTVATLTLDGCVNNGEIRGYNNGDTNTSYNGWGGLVGYIYNAYLTSGSAATIKDCINNGDVTAKEGSKAYKALRGGIVGQIVSVTDVLFENCVNNGDVLAPKNFAIGMGAYGTGGILGGARCFGDQWTKVKVSTFTFKNCINTGDISGEDAAGIFGEAATEVDLGEGVALNLNFEGCTNAGNITDVAKSNAAGILGYVKGWNVSIKNCNNGGNIQSEGCAGGIVASAGAADKNTAGGSLEGTFTIDTTVNYGTVGSKDTGTAGGIGANISLSTATIKNSINIGAVVAGTNDAIANATALSAQSTNNKYLKSDDVYSDNGSELATRALADAAAEATGLRACNYMTIYKLAVEYSTNSDKYTYDGNKTWANILALCATVKTEIENGMKSIFSYSQAAANDTYDKFMAEASLIRVKPDLEPLKAEIEAGLAKRDNGTVWTVNTLKRFNDALEVANALVALGDKADAAEVIEATAALKQAANSLRRDPTGGSGNNNNDNTNDENNNDNTNDENNNDNTNDENNNDNTNNDNTNDNTNDENTDNGGESVQPDQTEAPTTAPTQASTNEAEEEGGCGSVIGGAAIAVTAILALGAGVALKKKED